MLSSTQTKGKRTKNKATIVPLKDYTNCSRFVAPVSSPECEKAAKGVIPVNTQANSNWAITKFKEWALNRSAMTPDDPVPLNMLKYQDPDLLRMCLC